MSTATQAKKAIKKIADKHNLSMNQIDFYTPKEWEDMGHYRSGILVMVHDGGWLCDALNGYCGWGLHTEIYEAFNAIGLYCEMDNCAVSTVHKSYWATN